MKTIKPLTRKQAAFVKHIVDNPKQSATTAVVNTYGDEGKNLNRNTARSIATENLSKPAIQAELMKHSELFESAIVETVRDWKNEDNSRKREIATNLATWGHDKIYGRAKQQIEMKSTRVMINLDLTGQAEPTA